MSSLFCLEWLVTNFSVGFHIFCRWFWGKYNSLECSYIDLIADVAGRAETLQLEPNNLHTAYSQLLTTLLLIAYKAQNPLFECV